MKLYVFAMRDRVTDSYGNPMFFVAQGQAIRSFTDEINRSAEDSQLWKHPDDFDLFSLGEFDTDSGLFQTGVPSQVVLGSQVKIRK